MLFLSFLFSSLLCGASARPVAYPRAASVALFSQVKAVTSLSDNQVTDLRPFTFFAKAAYCPPEKVLNWTCGQACDNLKGFTPTLGGGDGDAVQFFFVGHWEDQNAVVVSHEGTDPTQLMSVLTDVLVTKNPLNSTLFPGVPDGVEVHDGFSDEHAKTADQILTEVKRLIGQFGSKKVITVGHSLGGALAELQALFLHLNLPSDIQISATTYGTPRVGNDDFVNFFDAQIPDFKRVNNKHDVVPTVPGRFLGFTHPKGEVHFLDDTPSAVACPGNDDADDENCQIQSVPDIVDGNIINHLGPYDGLFIGTVFCD